MTRRQRKTNKRIIQLGSQKKVIVDKTKKQREKRQRHREKPLRKKTETQREREKKSKRFASLFNGMI
jgi:3-polyprenyl-4-hydroxybenzoate decarboxylase